jgi:hypothetical protein
MPTPDKKFKAEFLKKLDEDFLKQIQGIGSAGIAALQGKGFPNFMILAFLNTAKETKTIVSSRLPGGVGLDLIENNCDLKGFHIKAKSCNWGPMAGFICQLPFLNKEGYKKIKYNTGFFMEYLEGLDRFSGFKNRIRPLLATQAALRILFSNTLTSVLDTKRKLYEVLLNLETNIMNIINKESAVLSEDEVKRIKFILKRENLEDFFGKLENKTLYNAEAARIGREYIMTEIQNVFARRIGIITTESGDKEKRDGEWSGDNTLPIEASAPFIPLVRSYNKSGQLMVKAFNAIPNMANSVVLAGNGSITGRAYNTAIAEKEAALGEINSTIYVEFLLKNTSGKLWKFYHGDIYYREPKERDFHKYEFQELTASDKFLEQLEIEPEKLTKQLDESDIEFLARTIRYEEEFYQYLNRIFAPSNADSFKEGETTYYPMRGLMNPHPPYPKGDNYYKNAVSGDYDLFAYWPSSQLSDIDITRKSEDSLNQNLKLATNASGLFYLDFIPGFAELKQEWQGVKLKESAEVGNINNLGYNVASTLNALANSSRTLAVNSAFHSDEGGRPSVMEIEFPIAFFFPHSILTTVFGSADKVAKTGGLVSKVEDFVQLLIDINYGKKGDPGVIVHTDKSYKIILQSEWMTHLLYLSLPAAERKSLWPKAEVDRLYATDYAGGVIPVSWDADKCADRKKSIDDQLGDFKKIDDKIPVGFDSNDFANKLKILLRGELVDGKLQPMNDATFTKMRNKFLEFAFQSGKKAISKKLAIEAILYADYLA